MKKRISYIIIGLIVIAIGVAYAGDILELWDVNFSFDGWWTVFIIAPAVISMVSGGINCINVIIAGIGILLFIGARDALPNDAAYKLIFPFVIVVFGFGILLKKTQKPTQKINNGLYAGESGENFFAVFGDNAPQFKGLDFRGASTFAIFGSIDLRLAESFIKRDCIINAYSVFGGTDIILPKSVLAKVSSTPVFGGVENNFVSEVDGQNAPTVYIRAVSVFGGVKIK